MADSTSTSPVPGPNDPSLMDAGLADLRAKVLELDARVLTAMTARDAGDTEATTTHLELAHQHVRELRKFFDGDAPAPGMDDLDTIESADQALAIEAKALAAELLGLARAIVGVVNAEVGTGDAEGINDACRADLATLIELAANVGRIGDDAATALRKAQTP